MIFITVFFYFLSINLKVKTSINYSQYSKISFILKLKNKINVFLKKFFVILPCYLVLVNRVGIGTDYFNYERIYNSIIFKTGEKTTYLFSLLIKLSNFVKINDYKFFISIVAMITLYFLYSFIYDNLNKKNYFLTIIFLFSYYFGYTTNIIRQMLAVGICMQSYKYIEKKDPFKFILIIGIASLVHSSAIVMLPIYFFYNKKENSSLALLKYIILLIGIILFFLVYLNYGKNYNLLYSSYIGETNEGGIVPLYLIFSLPIYILEFLYFKILIKKDNRNKMYFLMIIFEFVFFLFGSFIPYIFRMAAYFSIGHLKLITDILDTIKNKNRKKAKLLNICIVLFFLFRFYFFIFELKYDGIDDYFKYLV